MNCVADIQSRLHEISESAPKSKGVFYKTGPGEYAEHDKFLGVSVPHLRMIAKAYKNMTLDDLGFLLQSPINEMRLLTLFIVVSQYQSGNRLTKKSRYDFYFKNINYVNNWNLVDASAHHIVGAHLFDEKKDLLLSLARSDVMWERRIAMVSTWYFIKHDLLDWTVTLAEILLHDTQDLMHKAVGWMLREMGKRDVKVLQCFLEKHVRHMPRTMLRYAIEKFSDPERKRYLSLK